MPPGIRHQNPPHMNRPHLAAIAAALLAGLALTSCSLLKFTISSGDEPLPKEQVRLRTMTRGFYYDLTREVARTADSIASAAPRTATKLAAIRWKIDATRAASAAALQTLPEAALADTWIFCRSMERYFDAQPDSLLFDAQTPLARDAAARLARRAERLARELLKSDRYELMARFVDRYLERNPPEEGSPAAADASLAWIEFLEANGIEPDLATGTVAEVLADASDKVSGQSRQLVNSVGWSAQLLELRMRQDSLQSRLGAQLDSLERGFDRLVVVAEHMPEISDHMLEEIRSQATQLIHTLNYSVDNAFMQFDGQRAALEHYISAERRAVIDQLHRAADETVQAALDAVPGMIGRIVFYVVAGLVVLLGLPFLAGFWLGGLRQRAKERANTGSRRPESRAHGKSNPNEMR